ncbi:hypothetical protein EST38_g2550 [Candolleomyces aberdarensis]|uniref:Carboxylic ester hydrolase n=1 Tax=Candolleomyces aberdarensis TaxID=2316362 RepID=A0A4Q2DVR9_9AGAR|nr:hypothetical protein EST38_g2550 [Candolleomyces aberdarensis]
MIFTLVLVSALIINSARAVPPYGQCGGQGYAGSTQCDPGYVCTKLNDWYSQCLPGSNTPTAAPTTSTPTATPTSTPTTSTSTSTGTAGPPAASIPAGALTRLSNFGTNPSNVAIFVYKPSSVKVNPGLLLALHPCGGTAQQYFSGSGFRQLSDQRGFIVIYGSAANDQNCWDVTGANSLTHDGGGDSRGLASAVRYALSNWGINPDKVFVTGTSSGAMMTNVMAGVYPELFRGGAVFAGVAMGCLSRGNAPVFPADPCAAGQVSRTAQQWGDRIRQAYPGYTGPYPKMQLWHGTSDPVLNFTNLNEEVKQWTNIHGYSQTAATTSNGVPRQNWSKSVYGSGLVEGYTGQGSGHGLPESGTEASAIDWFGL